jgi:hypothetical protein
MKQAGGLKAKAAAALKGTRLEELFIAVAGGGIYETTLARGREAVIVRLLHPCWRL